MLFMKYNHYNPYSYCTVKGGLKMSENKNTLFSIGRFAELHKINKKTLMWYDEVGILKPAVVMKNGYRYYTYFQSPILETILLLRDLDISIPEIRDFLEHRSPGSLKTLLEETVSRVDSKLARLKNTRKTLLGRIKDTEFLMTADFEEISITEKDKEYLTILHTKRDISMERGIELVISEAERLELPHFYNASYGSMLPVRSIYERDFDNYTALYINAENNRKNKNAHIKPKGKYLRAFCKGSWDKLPDKYNEILEYADRKNIRLLGYSYETGINDITARSEDEYVTQIEILISDANQK